LITCLEKLLLFKNIIIPLLASRNYRCDSDYRATLLRKFTSRQSNLD